MFYVLAKAVFRFPTYWLYTVPLLLFALVSVLIAGYFAGGNVPRNRWRLYYKRFYIPTFGALAIVAINTTLDFIINLSATIINLLRVI
jgi:hypothetical protein